MAADVFAMIIMSICAVFRTTHVDVNVSAAGHSCASKAASKPVFRGRVVAFHRGVRDAVFYVLRFEKTANATPKSVPMTIVCDAGAS